MKHGVYIRNTFVGTSDFPGGETVTIHVGGPGVMDVCLKCPLCGYSITKPANWEVKKVYHLDADTPRCPRCDGLIQPKPLMRKNVTLTEKNIQTYGCNDCGYVFRGVNS